MSSQGTIIARVFTSNARIPLRGAAVVFYRTDAGGVRELLGLRLTEGIRLRELPLPEAEAESFRKKCGVYEKAGLLRIADGRMRMTPKGFLVSNQLLAELLDF